MMDSGIKNHGEVEYDKQNCVQHEKMQSGRKTRSAGYLLLPPTKIDALQKSFQLKTFGNDRFQHKKPWGSRI